MSHIVVEPDGVPGSERLVPIDAVADQRVRITLNVTRHEFFDFDMFKTSIFLPDENLGRDPDTPVRRWVLPFVHPRDAEITYATHEQIPKSTVALRRGTRVFDADGHHVGHVHAFVVDRTAQHVTHVVIEQAHVLRHRDVTVPISDVGHIGEERLTLSIKTDRLAKLPHIAVA